MCVRRRDKHQHVTSGSRSGGEQQTTRQHATSVLLPSLTRAPRAGKVGVDKEEASHLMGALDFGIAVKEICAAAAHLKAEGSPKVGVTGFCMGGALALLSAAKCDDLCCAAPFYGIPKDAAVDLSKMSKPVAGFFGERDASKGFSDPAAARALEAKLVQAGVEHEVVIYPGVGHGYLNDTPGACPCAIGMRLRSSADYSFSAEPFKTFEEREAAMGHNYVKEVAEESWTRLIAFFKRQLA